METVLVYTGSKGHLKLHLAFIVKVITVIQLQV